LSHNIEECEPLPSRLLMLAWLAKMFDKSADDAADDHTRKRSQSRGP
jgi:hypothetical protein